MPDRATLFLPLPRAIQATARPRRNPERIAAFDTLPVEFVSLTAREAPVALRRRTVAPAMFARDVRIHDGGFLMPLDLGGDPAGCTAEGLPGILAATVSRTLENKHYGEHRHLWDWQGQLRGTSRSRGLVDSNDLDLARVEDDGRAAQADIARYLATEIVLVDGRVHHRVPAPRYEVYGAGSVGYRPLTRTPYPVPWSTEPDRHTAFEFRPDRLDEADAFAELLVRRAVDEGQAMVPSPVPGESFEVLEPGLLAAALPPDDLPTATMHALAHFARAVRPAAGHLGDEGAIAYLELRALGRDGVPDDATAVASMERMRALLPEIEAIGGDRFLPFDLRDPMSRAAQATRDALLRHDAIDRPRKLGLPSEDLGLLSLAR